MQYNIIQLYILLFFYLCLCFLKLFIYFLRDVLSFYIKVILFYMFFIFNLLEIDTDMGNLKDHVIILLILSLHTYLLYLAIIMSIYSNYVIDFNHLHIYYLSLVLLLRKYLNWCFEPSFSIDLSSICCTTLNSI